VHRILLFLVLIALHPVTLAKEAVDAKAEGAKLTQAFYEARIDDVWERMDQAMRGALKSRDTLAAFQTEITAQLGPEGEVVEETVSAEQGVSVYRRRSRFANYAGVVVVLWAFSADGQVAGFRINPEPAASPPPAPSAYLDYQTKTPLRLPFDQAFFVFWGGRTVAQNYHAIDTNQRFAYDLVITRAGVTHAGDGRRNEDYYCFGQPILAPASGKVVDLVEGVPDNVPGQMNPAQVAGNRVILDHGDGEFSMLAHFRQGSFRVKLGDQVDAGAPLGECGNSGNSSEPHLHYQLQDGAAFGQSAGLPAKFTNYIADDQPIQRGEPVKGQTIRPAKTS